MVPSVWSETEWSNDPLHSHLSIQMKVIEINDAHSQLIERYLKVRNPKMKWEKKLKITKLIKHWNNVAKPNILSSIPMK